jgi:hypothetical protein
VFESDTVKYEKYFEAIKLALSDLQQGHPARLHAAVLGAGRGPLVDLLVRASKELNLLIGIDVVERNANAFRT